VKALFFFLATLLISLSQAADSQVLSPEQMIVKVAEVTDAQNKIMMRGSTMADVDELFSLYTDDFVYVHEVYGGTYTRGKLYSNTVKNLESGRYDMTEPRYTIVSTISGYNGIAVEREEIGGAKHLAVFEFNGDKVSRIVEYWR